MTISDFFNDPVHKEVSSALNDAVLSNKFTGNTSSMMGVWTKNDLLDADNSGASWRRFSLIEIYWIELVNKLRELGFGFDKIRVTKQDILMKDDKIPTTYPFLEYHLITAILYRRPYYVVICEGGQANIVGYDAYQQWIRSKELPTLHLVISMSQLYNELVQKCHELEDDFGEVYNLSEKELEILAFINQNEFHAIQITRKNGEISLIEGIERVDRKKRIVDILNQGDFQKLEILQENGKVAKMYRTAKKKF